MIYQTKSHLRTIITYSSIAFIGLVGIILSAILIKEAIIILLAMLVFCTFLLLGAFSLLKELKFSLVLFENTIEVHSLFYNKTTSISDIEKIEQSISDYTIILKDNRKFICVDIDLVNIRNIVEYLINKGIQVVITQ